MPDQRQERLPAWVSEARRRYWDAAASDNGVTYHADGDILTVHDPSIMQPGQAVRFDIRQVFHTDFGDFNAD
jgi:hypothetical protein